MLLANKRPHKRCREFFLTSTKHIPCEGHIKHRPKATHPVPLILSRMHLFQQRKTKTEKKAAISLNGHSILRTVCPNNDRQSTSRIPNMSVCMVASRASDSYKASQEEKRSFLARKSYLIANVCRSSLAAFGYVIGKCGSKNFSRKFGSRGGNQTSSKKHVIS